MSVGESNLTFMASHREALFTHLAEHLLLTGTTIIGALVLGVGLAIIAFRKPFLQAPILSAVSLLQTIPGIALLVMAMALLHRIGTAPALIALLLYALLPIVQNTVVGLTSLSPVLAEAARGLGLSRWQRLRHIRLPLAMPMIMAGLRTSAVQTVGLATLAAFVGAGGLGQFINRGLFLSDTRLILLGAVPSALLALIIHFLLSLLERAVKPGISRPMRHALIAVVLSVITLFAGFTAQRLLHSEPPNNMRITIGSKNFTEQLIVAEMVAQQIERETPLKVDRRFGLGGSSVVHAALTDGTIDLAVEYTGTALASILHMPIPPNHNSVFPIVRRAYHQQFQLAWLQPLGFNNGYCLVTRAQDPRLNNVRTLSDLVPRAKSLNAAFDFEFAERPDGYVGLQQSYGLQFAHVADMHPDLLYPALRKETTDVIAAYQTDGRLMQPGLRILRDNKHFFPPYEASIVVRESILAEHPELKKALDKLSGRLTTDFMRALNAAVDRKELTVEQAATRALGH